MSHNSPIGYFDRQKGDRKCHSHLLRLSACRVSNIFMGAQISTNQRYALGWCEINSFAVSRFNMSFNANLQLCMASVRDGSGQPLWVSVRVGTELSPDILLGSPMRLNYRFGYGLMDSPQPIPIGLIVSGLSNGSVCTFK